MSGESKISRKAAWIAMSCLVAMLISSATASDLYIVDETGVLGIVDVQTGQATIIGATGIVLTDIAFDNQGRLFGLTETRFYRIDPATAETTDVGPHGVPGANALVLAPDGRLLAAGGGSISLYSVDPDTGQATPFDTTDYYALGDMAFVDGTLYLTTATGLLVRVDLAGNAPSLPVAGPMGMLLYGMDTVNGVLCGAAGTRIFAIDTTTGDTTVLADFSGQGLGAAWGATAGPMTSNLPPSPDFAQYYEPYEPNVTPEAPGYTLPLDTKDIVNFADVDAAIGLAGAAELISANGFAIIEPNETLRSHWQSDDDISVPYTFLRGRDIPLFLSADTMLHLYHVQFDETLKEVEENYFIADINDLTAAMLDNALLLYDQLQGDLKEAARRNVEYFSVARKLIDPNAPVPALAAASVAGELAKIEAHEGWSKSDIFIYAEDYSQYVPRGHYTRSEALERYFKTMMWYGRIGFLLKGADAWGSMTSDALISVYDARIQTLQALLLATSLENVAVDQRSGLEIWDRLYAVTAFYVGLADDLTPYDYLWALDEVFANGFALEDLLDESNFFALKVRLALLPKPKIYGGTGNIILPPDAGPEDLDEVLAMTAGLRLMGQRFIPDSYMFQRLVYPNVGFHLGSAAAPPFTMSCDGVRGYPRGLDAMALLGSVQATNILIDEGDTNFGGYWQAVAELNEDFADLTETDWHANLYWSWLYALRALLDQPQTGTPNFMHTEAWQRHQLHSALASWTELRHDTILYAKQSTTPGRSGGPPVPPAYVEPVSEFWARLLSLAQMTSRGLDDFGVLSDQARQRLDDTEALIARLLAITNKQLTNEPLSFDDEAFIANLSESLERAVAGVSDTGAKTTLVADVHTESGDMLVLEEAVGHVDLIVVACPGPDDSVFLAVGPVLSYYEFKQPIDNRLTDEAWRDLLASPDRPARPKWYQPLVVTP